MSRKLKYITAVFLGCLMINACPVYAQVNSGIELELRGEPILTKSQMIELVTLTLDQSGQGARVFNFTIVNTSQNISDALFIELVVTASRFGVIAETSQRIETPFRMQPGQAILGDNNNIAQSRLPGIQNEVRFRGNITGNGEDFLNSLEGSSTLPVDVYRITMNIFSDANSTNGGTLVASETIVIGENLSDDDVSIFLLAPGDVAGSGMSISNPFPEFRWEGRPDQQYRLVVVNKSEGESPETLIQSALSTNPAARNGAANLLQFENLDVELEGTSFQFPTTGAQPLRGGEGYYWQVFATLRTSKGEEVRSSEIWEFSLAGRDGGGLEQAGQDQLVELDDEIFALLSAILGEEKALELKENNYRLDSIELDENQYTGETAKNELEELLEKLRDGKLKFTTNP